MFKSIFFASALVASALLIPGAALAQQAPQPNNFILGHGFVAPAAQPAIPGHQTKDVSLPANSDTADKSRNGTTPAAQK
jgi:hypothetical protein